MISNDLQHRCKIYNLMRANKLTLGGKKEPKKYSIFIFKFCLLKSERRFVRFGVSVAVLFSSLEVGFYYNGYSNNYC